jgi:hypothetical protein
MDGLFFMVGLLLAPLFGGVNANPGLKPGAIVIKPLSGDFCWFWILKAGNGQVN